MGSTILKWTINFLFSLAGYIVWWALKALWFGAVYAVRHPRSSIGLGLLAGAVVLVGWETVAAVMAVLIVAGSTWKRAHRDTWDRFVGDFLRSWWRRWFTYGRAWEEVLRRCGLVVEVRDEIHYPTIKKVTTTRYWDRLTVAMQIGQEVDDFAQAREKLRHAFGGERIAVTESKPRGVEIALMKEDPFLFETVPAAPMPDRTEDIDFTALPVGLTEFLRPYTISIVGAHTAGAGTSGAGKASLIWNILRALAPAIADGLVDPWFIDPKAKELRQGIGLLVDRSRYAVTAEETLDMLQRLVALMNEENERSGDQGERDHVPTLETPLRPIFVDEFAPLLAYWPRTIRDKIEMQLGLLLTQGRAAGFIVIGLIQEPTKDVFKIRDLFGRRVGFALPSKAHTEAAIADDVVEMGALCHKIPEALPGVVFQLLRGAKEVTRNRFGHVRNEDIHELVEFVQRRREAARFEARRNAADDRGSEAA
jgi:S-DNA-T family DNA segregation ATPase FtsK/SpoIIIE